MHVKYFRIHMYDALSVHCMQCILHTFPTHSTPHTKWISNLFWNVVYHNASRMHIKCFRFHIYDVLSIHCIQGIFHVFPSHSTPHTLCITKALHTLPPTCISNVFQTAYTMFSNLFWNPYIIPFWLVVHTMHLTCMSNLPITHLWCTEYTLNAMYFQRKQNADQ